MKGAHVKILHVIVFGEDGIWYAQGVEVDYIAQGKTAEEAMQSFELGFFESIEENSKNGRLDEFLNGPIDQDTLNDLMRRISSSARSGKEMGHIKPQQRSASPYETLEFLQP